MKQLSHLARATCCISAVILAAYAPKAAHADAIPYQNVGTPNATTYTFTATADGDIIAYFAGGSQASYDNELGMLVNGVSTGVIGLDNHSSSLGQSLDLGHVTAGETLVFVLQNNTLGKDAYSDPSLNTSYDTSGVDGHNHVYSTAYTANPPIDSIPDGTYVAFEDLPFPGSDFNYNDESFVFTDVTTTMNGVPDSASTLGLLGLGLTGISLLGLRKLNA